MFFHHPDLPIQTPDVYGTQSCKIHLIDMKFEPMKMTLIANTCVISAFAFGLPGKDERINGAE